MEFEVTDSGAIRTLARVFQGASKVGDDVMIGSGAGTVQMRTLNNTHSTCAMFVFRRPFFDRLTLPSTQLDIKLPSRAVLPIFRTPANIQSLRVSTNDDSLTVRTVSRSRLLKTYHVPVLEGRLGVTVFSRTSCSCSLSAPSRFWQDVLTNFSTRLDEITLTPTTNTVRVASFADVDPSATLRMLRTEMELSAAEFESYNFAKPETEEVSLTIFCRYFRGFLEFSDHFDAPMRMHYEAAGMPLLFELDFNAVGLDSHFDAQYVFATRHVDSEMIVNSSAEHATTTGTPSGSAARRRSRPLKVQHQPLQTSRPPSDMSQPQVGHSQPPPLPPSTSPLQNRRETTAPAAGALAGNAGTSHVSETPENEEHEEIVLETPAPKTKVRRRILTESESTDAPKSMGDERKSVLDESIPETPQSQPHKKRSSYADLGDSDESSNDSDDEFVEGTPPASPD